MSDNTNAIDPLDCPAGEQEAPSMPLLRKQKYRMEIRGIEEKQFEGKDGKAGSSAVSIKLVTTEDGRSTEDKVLHKGFPVNASIFTSVNEFNSIDQIKAQCAMPVKAALGAETKVTLRQCINDPSILVGQVVDVMIEVKKAKEGSSYGDQNIVKSWIVPTPVKK